MKGISCWVLLNTISRRILDAKHKQKQPSFMPSIIYSKPPLIVEVDCVHGCIKSFSKGTPCERDGMSTKDILDALCGDGMLLSLILYVLSL